MQFDTEQLRRHISDAVCERFAGRGQFFVPVASSNRHVHLSQAHVEALFGARHALTPLRALKQPGQFACREQVTLKTEKGSILLRVVGPARAETQAELSAAEAIKLGLPVLVRMSGDLAGSPGATLQTEKGAVRIESGVIVAARHLHLSDAQAKLYRLRNGDSVRLFAEGARGLVFENVQVRCGAAHTLEAHIDIEEWNAAGLADGAVCRIEKQVDTAADGRMFLAERVEGLQGNIVPAKEAPIYATSGIVREKFARGALPEPAKKKLLTEADILAAHARGETSLSAKGYVLTPLALDRAKRIGVEVIL
ncbi:MAG: PduL/EutD family phosphate acyltransferase [Clostridiales bacterium]|nr:PduL/EutD family phosphate acyltransferase [Clostridiales bacterium]